jgi:hypothetical protein
MHESKLMTDSRCRASGDIAVIGGQNGRETRAQSSVVSQSRLRASIVVSVLSLAFVFLGVAPAVVAGEGAINVTTTVEQVSDGSIMVESTVSVPDDQGVIVSVAPPTRRTEIRAHTFDKKQDDRYRTQSDARIRYRIDPRSGSRIESPGDTLPVGTDSWALVSALPHVAYSHVQLGGDPGLETTTRVRGPGSAGDRLVFLGDVETATRDPVAGTSVRLVVPQAAGSAPAKESILEMIVAADSDLDVADTDRVDIFVAPPPAARGGQTAGTDVWVEESSEIEGASTWLHEFVHTQQRYRPGEQMRWFTEASADYYATLLAAEQGRITSDAFRAEITSDRYEGDELADPDTWNSSDTPYEKGPRVLAALDMRIRNTTDGSRTLKDVFVLMNDHEGKLTYEDFTDYVAEVAGVRMDIWLSVFIHRTEVPDPPQDPATYGYTLESETAGGVPAGTNDDEDSGSWVGNDGGISVRDAANAGETTTSLYIIGIGAVSWILITALSGVASLLRRLSSMMESLIPEWAPRWGRRLGFALFVSSLVASTAYMTVW